MIGADLILLSVKKVFGGSSRNAVMGRDDAIAQPETKSIADYITQNIRTIYISIPVEECKKNLWNPNEVWSAKQNLGGLTS